MHKYNIEFIDYQGCLFGNNNYSKEEFAKAAQEIATIARGYKKGKIRTIKKLKNEFWKTI